MTIEQMPEDISVPDEVEHVERTRDEVRDEARRRLGVTGGGEENPPKLRQVLRNNEVSAYPLFALGLLSIVDTFQGYAFGVLTPEISGSLGIGKGTIAAVIAVKTLANALGPLPIAALTQQRARRAAVVIVSGVLWSIVAISTGFVTAVAGLVAVLIFDGFTTASTAALHGPLVMDSYPPEGRVRAMSYYQGANSFGNVLAPLIVAVLTTSGNMTWRGVFVVMGLISLVAALAAARLRDPGIGRWDTDQIRAAVHEHDPGVQSTGVDELSESDTALGFFEIVRRLLLIPTIRRLLIGFGVFGVLLIPYQTFLAFFLSERWNMGPGARGLFVAFLAAVSMVALGLFGQRGEAQFRRDPGGVVELGAVFLAIGIGFICLAALSPYFWVMVLFFGLAAGMLAVLGPALGVSLLSVIPPSMRPHAAALSGIFTGAGGVAGALLLGGVDRRFGIAGTIVSLAVPGVAGALIIRSTGKLVGVDLDRMIDETIENEEIQQLTRSGQRMPMLRVRGVDFSYGQVQVLFGVDFTVDDGEMVALLGTNGAGKSTLLKVISGIGLPSAGSVRYRGQEITYLDAERRLYHGITQIPGGKAVFGPMTVVENLQLYGYSLGRDRKSLGAAIDRSFDAFPRLAERSNQKSSTLSGGEQQMLALSKALILRPRLLLIDELSLGLAPVVVGELLEMVREINQDGTAVVLVEQSVNIALGLVDHAYFMEKGEIRFDGPSHELLQRSDLLRAVFLEGVADEPRAPS